MALHGGTVDEPGQGLRSLARVEAVADGVQTECRMAIELAAPSG